MTEFDECCRKCRDPLWDSANGLCVRCDRALAMARRKAAFLRRLDRMAEAYRAERHRLIAEFKTADKRHAFEDQEAAEYETREQLREAAGWF